MKELLIFLFTILVIFIILCTLQKKTKESFLQINNNLGWGGCGLTDWF
jgi:hypothetical protein